MKTIIRRPQLPETLDFVIDDPRATNPGYHSSEIPGFGSIYIWKYDPRNPRYYILFKQDSLVGPGERNDSAHTLREAFTIANEWYHQWLHGKGLEVETHE